MVGFQGSMTPVGGWEASDIITLNKVVRLIWERNYTGKIHGGFVTEDSLVSLRGIFFYKELFTGNASSTALVSSIGLDFWEYMQEVMTPSEAKRVELYQSIFPGQEVDTEFLKQWRQLTDKMIAEKLLLRVYINVGKYAHGGNTIYGGEIGYCVAEQFKDAKKGTDIEDGICLYYAITDATPTTTLIAGGDIHSRMKNRQSYPGTDGDSKKKTKNIKEQTFLWYWKRRISDYVAVYGILCLLWFIFFAAIITLMVGEELPYAGFFTAPFAFFIAFYPLFFKRKRREFSNPCFVRDVYPEKIRNRLLAFLDDDDKARVSSSQKKYEDDSKDYLDRRGSAADYRILEVKTGDDVNEKVAERPYLGAVFKDKDKFRASGANSDFPRITRNKKRRFRKWFFNVHPLGRMILLIGAAFAIWGLVVFYHQVVLLSPLRYFLGFISPLFELIGVLLVIALIAGFIFMIVEIKNDISKK